MITKRIIPCLDVRNGRVVKGTNFCGLQDVSSPVELGKFYSDNGADELVFYDITASAEGRRLFTDILTEVTSTIFIPLTVGSGIHTVEDFDRVLKCGAEKVSVNSGAIRDPGLVREAARLYGDLCVVLNSIDTDGVKGGFDLPMLEAVSNAVDVPVIASGGAGSKENIITLFKNPSQSRRGPGNFHFPLWTGTDPGLEADAAGSRYSGEVIICLIWKS